MQVESPSAFEVQNRLHQRVGIEMIITAFSTTSRVYGISPIYGPPGATILLRAKGFFRKKDFFDQEEQYFRKTRKVDCYAYAKLKYGYYIVKEITSWSVRYGTQRRSSGGEIPCEFKDATCTTQMPVIEAQVHDSLQSTTFSSIASYDVPQGLDVWLQLFAVWPAVNSGFLNLTDEQSEILNASEYNNCLISDSALTDITSSSLEDQYHCNPVPENFYTHDSWLQQGEQRSIASNEDEEPDLNNPELWEQLRSNWPIQAVNTNNHLELKINYLQQGGLASKSNTHVPGDSWSSDPSRPSSGLRPALPEQVSCYQENLSNYKYPYSYEGPDSSSIPHNSSILAQVPKYMNTMKYNINYGSRAQHCAHFRNTQQLQSADHPQNMPSAYSAAAGHFHPESRMRPITNAERNKKFLPSYQERADESRNEVPDDEALENLARAILSLQM